MSYQYVITKKENGNIFATGSSLLSELADDLYQRYGLTRMSKNTFCKDNVTYNVASTNNEKR